MISAYFFYENEFLRGELELHAKTKNEIFKNFRVSTIWNHWVHL